MKALEIEQWAQRHGYVRNRHGKFEKTTVVDGITKVRRLVISKIAVRLEVRVDHSHTAYGPRTSWVRLRSGYLKNLFLTPDDKLNGLKRAGC